MLPGVKHQAFEHTGKPDSEENLQLHLNNWWRPQLTVIGMQGLPTDLAMAGNARLHRSVSRGRTEIILEALRYKTIECHMIKAQVIGSFYKQASQPRATSKTLSKQGIAIHSKWRREMLSDIQQPRKKQKFFVRLFLLKSPLQPHPST